MNSTVYDMGIDHGNSYIKMNNPGILFPAGIVGHGSERPAITNNVDVIEHDGTFYSLSPTSRKEYKPDKTSDDTYFILTLLAVAKYLEDMVPGQREYTGTVRLGVGVPPAHVGNSYRKKFRDYLSRGGETIKFRHNDISFSIRVAKVQVGIQGLAAASRYYTSFAHYPLTFIIDIGGHTIDVIKLVKGVPDNSYIESFDDVGMLPMIHSITRSISSKFRNGIYRPNYEAIVIEDIAATGQRPADMPENIFDFACDEIQDYSQEIINHLSNRDVNLSSSFAVFTGGGAGAFKPALMNLLPKGKDFIYITELNANAVGYYGDLITARKA